MILEPHDRVEVDAVGAGAADTLEAHRGPVPVAVARLVRQVVRATAHESARPQRARRKKYSRGAADHEGEERHDENALACTRATGAGPDPANGDPCVPKPDRLYRIRRRR